MNTLKKIKGIKKGSNQRIKYKETKKSGILISAKKFVGNQGGLYSVELNLNEMTYTIRNVRQQIIVRSTVKDGKTPPTHFVTLKRQAKQALMSLGVKFDIEIRAIN